MTEKTAYARDVDERALAASVVKEFERQVDWDPNRDAIRRPGKRITGNVSFGELDAWANAIAAELIGRRGRKPEPVPLAVCSPDLMLAAALGTLKAGKFYVAVNPMHPAAHVQRVLDELDASLLLCDSRGEIAMRRGMSAVSVEEVLEAGGSKGRLNLPFGEDRLAYVLYTSGSTGRPRGVAQSRRDMLHNVARHRPLAIGREDCVTLISADGFVVAVSNPYIALVGGAALAPFSFKDSGVESMGDWLSATGVTVLYAFPSFLRQLAAVETVGVHDRLRLVYLGGETVLPADLAAARRLFPAAALSVGLNSSETGLTCLHLVPPASALPDPVPAGRPVIDVEVAVVSESGRRLPSDAYGEIEIRSDYVQPRYWHRGGVEGGCLRAPAFRTGDRGRIDADGIVYHAGRVDQLVKIRGFRVETTEVEAAISRHPGVAEVAVFSAGDASTAQLTACVVARGQGVDPVAVRSVVARELPPAMIPTRVLIVDALPRTSNGKLDRKSLAGLADRQDPGVTSTPTGANWSARQPHDSDQNGQRAVQHRIAAIWSSALGIDDVASDVDFFALGGTSLTAVSVISQVRGEFGVSIPLAALFRSPTVSALANAVTQLRGDRTDDDGQMVVRLAQAHDFPDICALVNHYIEHTHFNFQTKPQTPHQWVDDWSATRARYSWLVASINGVIAGVAYAGPWKGRAAYDWCAEVTVYVTHNRRHAGIGRALYRQLLSTLDRHGYRTEVAVITLPNPPSVSLHEAFGFRHAGTLNGIGYKNGAWLDVGFWQRRQPSGEEPREPLAVVTGA